MQKRWWEDAYLLLLVALFLFCFGMAVYTFTTKVL